MPIRGISSSEPLGVVQRDPRYDSATIWLHWLTVSVVAILWILGQVTNWLPRGPFRLGVWSTHVVLGLTLAVVLATRILWRAGFGSTLPPADKGVLHWLAKGTHYALYLLLVAVVILGIANASSSRLRSVWRFDHAAVRRWRSGNRAQHLHCMSGPRKPGCAHCFLHTAAALGHQYISRDRLLLRMRQRL